FAQSAALLAASVTAWPAWPARAALAAVAPLDDATIALVDRDLPGGAAFARAARQRGMTTLEFAADVAELWMRELEPRLRNGPIRIAGHASAATLFCLDLLARDFGARTVRRVDAATAVSFVISQYSGPRAALAPAAVRAQWRHSYG
ncbi:MAG TPA: hypothetical protein VM692_17170, partial [Gammaproteobacteria bacterium]|nr:hypothetical protein [Gammaproteobacteria bacterium]